MTFRPFDHPGAGVPGHLQANRPADALRRLLRAGRLRLAPDRRRQPLERGDAALGWLYPQIANYLSRRAGWDITLLASHRRRQEDETRKRHETRDSFRLETKRILGGSALGSLPRGHRGPQSWTLGLPTAYADTACACPHGIPRTIGGPISRVSADRQPPPGPDQEAIAGVVGPHLADLAGPHVVLPRGRRRPAPHCFLKR